MNKLMIAAAATLCAAVGYSDITSANIVGYSSSTLDHYTIATPQFSVVGNDAKFKIGDIKPVGEGLDGVVAISTLDGEGYGADSYYWYEWGEPDVGWYDGEKFVTDVEFDPGTAFWIENNGDPIPFQSAGQVSKSDVTFPLSHYTIVGNPNPAPVKINDILPLCKEPLDGMIAISTLDGEGYGADSYYWYDWGDPDVGWYDGEKFISDEIVALAGQAFWVENNLEETVDVSLYIPAIEIK